MDELVAVNLLISDVSSVAIDHLLAGRLLLVTMPPDPGVVIAATKMPH